MRTFHDVWLEAGQIKRLVFNEDCRVLYERACAMPRNQIAVNVGAFCGCSTVVLAASGRTVWSIDPMIVGTADSICEEHVKMLRQNVARYPNAVWIRGTALDAHDPVDPVGLLFIDGNHHDPWPMVDYLRFARHMVPGATVAFHDYPAAPDVRSTVDVLLKRRAAVEPKMGRSAMFCRIGG